MRPLAVVVVGVDAQYVFEVAAVEDQQPNRNTPRGPCGRSALDRVRLWRSYRRLHDPDHFAPEDLVEGTAVLAVAIADQEARLSATTIE